VSSVLMVHGVFAIMWSCPYKSAIMQVSFYFRQSIQESRAGFLIMGAVAAVETDFHIIHRRIWFQAPRVRFRGGHYDLAFACSSDSFVAAGFVARCALSVQLASGAPEGRRRVLHKRREAPHGRP